MTKNCTLLSLGSDYAISGKKVKCKKQKPDLILPEYWPKEFWNWDWLKEVKKK